MLQLTIYSHLLHGYISLDGFNEFELIESPGNRMAGYPTDPFVMQGISNVFDVWKYLFARCDGELLRTQLASNILMHLRTYYYLTQLVRQTCQAAAVGLATRGDDASTYMSAFTFPNTVSDPLQQRSYNEEMFIHYIRTTSAITKAGGIKALHIIQPVPALKKVMSADERLRVQDLNYGPHFQKMIRDRMALNAEGIPVVSLAGLFDETPGDIFIDRIHLNQEGQAVLLEKLVQTIQSRWGLRHK